MKMKMKMKMKIIVVFVVEEKDITLPPVMLQNIFVDII
jgi:hypothetical protein